MPLSTSHVDVIVVGGGPAGLSSAINCAQLGIRVAVIEKQTFPVDKVCGEGIMPEGVSELKRLGVFDLVDKDQMTPMDGVCFINERGVKAHVQFSPTSGLGLRRLALSKALLQRAEMFPNIEILPSQTVKDIAIEKKSVTVTTNLRSLSARLVIGADGLRSFVRNHLATKKTYSTIRRYGLRQHFMIEPWSKNVEVYFKGGVEAYITPSGPHQTNVTFLWHKSAVETPINFASLLERFPEVRLRVEHQRELSKAQAIGPLHQKVDHITGDGIALVGDASGYYDAITGEGNSLALLQSRRLAEIIAPVMKTHDGVITKKDLRSFEIAHKNIVRNYYRNTKSLLLLAKNAFVMNKVIDLASRHNRAFNLLVNGARGG